MTATFTTTELAERWSMDRETVVNRIRAGELPGFKVGRRYRVPAEAVEAVEAGADPAMLDAMTISPLSAKRRGLK